MPNQDVGIGAEIVVDDDGFLGRRKNRGENDPTGQYGNPLRVPANEHLIPLSARRQPFALFLNCLAHNVSQRAAKASSQTQNF